MKTLCLMGTLMISSLCLGGNEQGGFGGHSKASEEKKELKDEKSVRFEIVTCVCRYLVPQSICDSIEMSSPESSGEEED